MCAGGQDEDGMKTSAVFGRKPALVISANIMAGLFGAIVVWLVFALASERQEVAVNAMLSLLGAVLGWAVGILATPLNPRESARFVTLGQAVAAFLSGYVVSKLDRFLEGMLFPGGAVPALPWQRLGLFALAFLLLLTIVFVNRSYIHSEYDRQHFPGGQGRT
jgi:predicted membrane-bound spermidine synthase